MSRRGARLCGVLVVVALLAGVPAGLASEDPPPQVETRVFLVKHRAVEEVALLVRPALGDQGSVTMQPRIKLVTVTDEPARLDQISRLIASFDIPPRHVHLAVSLLMGRQEPDPEDRSPTMRAPRMPGIDRDLRQALALTSWTDYSLLGSASFTAAEGEESTLSLGEDYRIRLKVGTVNPEQASTRFEQFALERRHVDDSGAEELRTIWDQVLNLRDNQLYVFGATRLEESRRAIFLSITAGIVR